VERPLWREGGSAVFSFCWTSPAQPFSGPSPTGLMSKIYCLNFLDFPNLEGQVPVFIPPRNRVALLYPTRSRNSSDVHTLVRGLACATDTESSLRLGVANQRCSHQCPVWIQDRQASNIDNSHDSYNLYTGYPHRSIRDFLQSLRGVSSIHDRVFPGARRSIVGWGTVLQAGRSRVRFSVLFSWPNPSSCTMALGSTRPLTASDVTCQRVAFFIVSALTSSGPATLASA
jgi:hypothetical protein